MGRSCVVGLLGVVLFTGCAPLPLQRLAPLHAVASRPTLAELVAGPRDARLDAYELTAFSLPDARAQAEERCVEGVDTLEESAPRERAALRCTPSSRRGTTTCRPTGEVETVRVFYARCFASGETGTTRVRARDAEREAPPVCGPR